MKAIEIDNDLTEDEFEEFLNENFDMPVVCGNPWVNILKSSLKEIPELSYEESLAYATVLGLASRGGKKC